MSENVDSHDPFGVLEGYSPSDPQPIEQEEQKFVGLLEDKIQEAERVKKIVENDWQFNLLQLQGEQFIVKDTVENGVLRVAVDATTDETPPAVDNKLLPTHRAFVGKLVRIIPAGVVLPATDDRDDLMAAEILDSHMEFQWRQLKLKKMYKRGQEFLSWAGTAIYGAAWSPLRGPVSAGCPLCGFSSDAEQPGNPCPVCLVEKGQQYPLVRMRPGDVEATLYDPREFFPEPGVSEIEDMQWCYVKKALPVNMLRRLWPEHKNLIHAEEGIYSERHLVYTGGPGMFDTSVTRLQDHAYLFCFHEAPTGAFPTGRIVYMTNHRVMEQKPSPYYELLGRHPFFAHRADRIAGKFWGLPPISQAAPLQEERNTLSTQLRDYRELTVNPKVLSHENDGVEVDRFNTIAGEVIKFRSNPFGAPKLMELPQLPQYIPQEFVRLEEAIREKFGVTPHEMGIVQGDPSGRFSAMLESQSSESIAPIIIENLDEWLEFLRAILLISLRYYSKTRKWAIVGTDRPRAYSYGDVEAIRSGWDLLLADEDSLSKNPSLRLQQSLMLWDKGIYIDESSGLNDKQKFLRHAGLRMPGTGPDLNVAYRTYASQIPRLVQAAVETGQPPPQVYPWDDALILCQELLGWLRGAGHNAPEPVVRYVAMLWFKASLALMPQNPEHMKVMPPPIAMQAFQQTGQIPGGPPGAGGSPNPVQQPQTMGAGGSPPGQQQGGPNPAVQQDTASLVHQADQTAEHTANPIGKREGSTL